MHMYRVAKAVNAVHAEAVTVEVVGLVEGAGQLSKSRPAEICS